MYIERESSKCTLGAVLATCKACACVGSRPPAAAPCCALSVSDSPDFCFLGHMRAQALEERLQEAICIFLRAYVA